MLLIIPVVLIIVVALFFVGKSLLSRVGGGGEANLTWWGLWEEESVIAPLIAEYQASHPKVKITYIKQSPQDYRERLTNSLAKGQGPDIFRFHNTWVPMFRDELDAIPTSVMSAGEYSQTFYPVFASDLTSGTGIVGIPLMYDGLVLYINEEIFNKEGKTPPATWDDLRQLAIQLTIKDDQGVITQAGVAMGRTENVDHWQEILALLMMQNDVSMGNPSGKLAEDALTFFTLFSSQDGVWDATLPPSTIAFSSGKLAMYFAPSWRSFEIKQQNPNLKFKTVPLPQVAKASPTEPDISYATYWAEGVWVRSKGKEAAWEFLKFLSSKESLAKLYQEAAKIRTFGEPYPRVDMAELLSQDSILGSLIQQAPNAESWYLASRTFDGPTGINSLIGKYFEDAINAVNARTTAAKALIPVADGVKQVLNQYGLSRE
jgi:multiple sugar transport system substrate-binding protein